MQEKKNPPKNEKKKKNQREREKERERDFFLHSIYRKTIYRMQ